MKKIIAEIKSVLLPIYHNGLIRLLLLLVLVLISLLVFLNKNNISGAKKFGKIIYPQNILGPDTVSSGQKISFTFDKNLSLPKSASVFVVEAQSETSLLALFERASLSLGLTTQPEINTSEAGKTYLRSQKDLVFYGKIPQGTFSFTGKSLIKFNNASEQTLTSEVLNFINKVGLNADYQLAPSVAYYKRAGSEFVSTNDKREASVLSLSYRIEINSIGLIGVGEAESLLVIYVNFSDGNLIRLDYSLPVFNKTQKGVYPLIGFKEISLLRPEQLKIIEVSDKNGAPSSSGNVKEMVFNKISLVYGVFPPPQAFLYPLFLLEGKATFNNNEQGIVKAYVEAIKN
ncbi:hypothetical protein HY030_03150 [Candidatus Gottesmanbacteria bacterium]|nr:hypothetical protein [Candidatus Gottesmanbacteria bacterium]